MALRISEAAHTSPESWLSMQTKLDLWNALQKKNENVSDLHHQQVVWSLIWFLYAHISMEGICFRREKTGINRRSLSLCLSYWGCGPAGKSKITGHASMGFWISLPPPWAKDRNKFSVFRKYTGTEVIRRSPSVGESGFLFPGAKVRKFVVRSLLVRFYHRSCWPPGRVLLFFTSVLSQFHDWWTYRLVCVVPAAPAAKSTILINLFITRALLSY